ncbi:MAG TPA: DUF3052 domain-containing protein [Anaerolineae bacterium]
MAGYSKRSLVQKLGLKPDQRIIILNPPPDYNTTLGDLPDDVVISKTLSGPLDFIHYFTKERVDLEQQFPRLKQALAPAGMLWISWPKQASKVKTDVNENVVRDIGLSNGLVDVKVSAIDETWSGLKFVYRLADRR